MSRIALVTGAGRGIGRAIGLRLASQGIRVAAAARSELELQSLASEIAGGPGDCLPCVSDLCERRQIGELVGRVESHWGPVQILVNNAGIGSSADPKPLVDFDDHFWDVTMELNVTAPYLLTKRVLPGMVAQRWGRIVNIASINARVAAPHGAAYAASKHALAGLTKATALEHAGDGITANAVCPGVTSTRMNDLRLQYDAQRLGQRFEELESQASPLGRRLRPDEVAAAVAFLASEDADAINGQLLNVCGGKVMQ